MNFNRLLYYNGGILKELENTDHDFSLSVEFDSSTNYAYFEVEKNWGSYEFNSLNKQNINSFILSKNSSTWINDPSTIDVSVGDSIELIITKNNNSIGATLGIVGSYPINISYDISTNSPVKYVDQWMLNMLNSYQTIHDNMLNDPEFIEKFLEIHQPNYTIYDTSGNAYVGELYNTYGPSGLNKTECDYVILTRLCKPTVACNVTGQSHTWYTNGYSGEYIRYQQFYDEMRRYSFTSATTLVPTDPILFDDSKPYGYSIMINNLVLRFIYNLSNSLCSQYPNFKNLTYYQRLSIQFTNVSFSDKYTLNLSANENSALNYTNIRKLPKITMSTRTTLTASRSLNFSVNQIETIDDDNWNFFARNFSNYQFSSNRINQSTVDKFFLNMHAFYSVTPPVVNCTVNLQGGLNASPTGGALNTYIVLLKAIWTSAGYTLTVNIN